jgi:hypothetical protein
MGSLAQKVISASRPGSRLRPNDQHRSSDNQDNVSCRSERLWVEMERRLAYDGINKLRTLLLGFNAKELDQILHVFGFLDTGMTASIPDLSALQGPDNLWELFEVVMINHDAFDDSDLAVDEYLAFRERFADKIVLLVSRDVAQDDLSTERTAICDATLRFPLSPERLLVGLRAARSNRKAKRAGKAV